MLEDGVEVPVPDERRARLNDLPGSLTDELTEVPAPSPPSPPPGWAAGRRVARASSCASERPRQVEGLQGLARGARDLDGLDGLRVGAVQDGRGRGERHLERLLLAHERDELTDSLLGVRAGELANAADPTRQAAGIAAPAFANGFPRAAAALLSARRCFAWGRRAMRPTYQGSPVTDRGIRSNYHAAQDLLANALQLHWIPPCPRNTI